MTTVILIIIGLFAVVAPFSQKLQATPDMKLGGAFPKEYSCIFHNSMNGEVYKTYNIRSLHPNVVVDIIDHLGVVLEEEVRVKSVGETSQRRYGIFLKSDGTMLLEVSLLLAGGFDRVGDKLECRQPDQEDSELEKYNAAECRTLAGEMLLLFDFSSDQHSVVLYKNDTATATLDVDRMGSYSASAGQILWRIVESLPVPKAGESFDEKVWHSFEPALEVKLLDDGSLGTAYSSKYGVSDFIICTLLQLEAGLKEPSLVPGAKNSYR